LKRFSVIIPDTDSTRIGDTLEALRRQSVDLSEGEILVLGSDRPGLVHSDKLVRFIPTDPQNSFASDKRNQGMKIAQGEIYFFLDDDCIPYPDWIERHLYRHELGEKVVGGAVVFGRRNYLQLTDNLSAFHIFLPSTVEGSRAYLTTSNLSVHHSVVTRAGVMEAHQNRAEDMEWTTRFRTYGYRLYFDPKAIVLHDPERCTFASVARHWVVDAPSTLRIRLLYAESLNTPRLAHYRWMYLWGSPLVAAWATLRAFKPPGALAAYWHTLPLVYLTKLIWCWSAYQNFPSGGNYWHER
jgi:glycosyltransferase involved in cell wall biosynthesis